MKTSDRSAREGHAVKNDLTKCPRIDASDRVHTPGTPKINCDLRIGHNGVRSIWSLHTVDRSVTTAHNPACCRVGAAVNFQRSVGHPPRRYQQRSTIFTTNKPFSEWQQVFPNAACVVTIIDRLVHKAEILTIEGESYRLKEARERAAHKTKARKQRTPKP